jgi:hypothetical protein
VKFVEHPHQLFRLDRLDERRPAAQVGDEHRDLPAVTGQERLVA